MIEDEIPAIRRKKHARVAVYLRRHRKCVPDDIVNGNHVASIGIMGLWGCLAQCRTPG